GLTILLISVGSSKSRLDLSRPNFEKRRTARCLHQRKRSTSPATAPASAFCKSVRLSGTRCGRDARAAIAQQDRFGSDLLTTNQAVVGLSPSVARVQSGVYQVRTSDRPGALAAVKCLKTDPTEKHINLDC